MAIVGIDGSAARAARSRTAVTSDGVRREAHDVPAARLLAPPALERGDRPERGDHLPHRDARRRVGREDGGRGRCGAVARGVRARPSHPPTAPGRRGPPRGRRRAGAPRATRDGSRTWRPASGGPAGPRRRPARGPVRSERRGELVDLLEQLVGALVAAGDRSLALGQVGARPAQADGHRAQPLAVRLVGEPPLEVADGVGGDLQVQREPRRERRGVAPGADADRDRPREPLGHRLVPAEDVVRVEAERRAGHGAGDVGVAVAVAADPAAPADHGGHERRPRPGPAVVARDGPGPVGRQGVEGAVERAVQARGGGEDRRVEVRESRPDLVERQRPATAGILGPPEDHDLLAQAAPHLGVLPRRQVRVLPAREERVDAAERQEHRPAAGLRGMRRHDRRDHEPPDERHGVVAPLGPRHGPDRGVHRAVRRGAGAGASLGPACRADPRPLLRRVRELEVEREGPGEALDPPEVQPVEELVERGLPVGGRPAPFRDRRAAHRLHEVEQLGSGLLRDRLAEERPEEPDLAPERVAAGAGAERGLRADGRVRAAADGASGGGHGTGYPSGGMDETTGYPTGDAAPAAAVDAAAAGGARGCRRRAERPPGLVRGRGPAARHPRDRRPVGGPPRGGHVPADADRPRRGVLAALPRPLPHPRGARRGAAPRRDPRLGGARATTGGPWRSRRRRGRSSSATGVASPGPSRSSTPSRGSARTRRARSRPPRSGSRSRRWT